MSFVPAKEKGLGSISSKETAAEDDELHLVHGGMLKTAELMGLPGKPVHTAVANALMKNRGYGTRWCLFKLLQPTDSLTPV